MPWFLPLLLLAAGTGMQYKAEKRRKVATERGILERRRAEDARQEGYEQKVSAAKAEAGKGLSAEDQSAVEKSSAAERQALYDSQDIKPADAGYQNPAERGAPRVIRTDADTVARAADAYVANQGAARSQLSGRGDAQQAEALRLAPIARQIARQRDFAARSAAMLPNEIQTAIAQGASKGRKTAMGGQLLSTLGTLAMASPAFAQGISGLFGKAAAGAGVPIDAVVGDAAAGAATGLDALSVNLPTYATRMGGAVPMSAPSVSFRAAAGSPALSGLVDATAPSATAYLRSIGRAAPRVF